MRLVRCVGALTSWGYPEFWGGYFKSFVSKDLLGLPTLPTGQGVADAP